MLWLTEWLTCPVLEMHTHLKKVQFQAKEMRCFMYGCKASTQDPLPLLYPHCAQVPRNAVYGNYKDKIGSVGPQSTDFANFATKTAECVVNLSAYSFILLICHILCFCPSPLYPRKAWLLHCFLKTAFIMCLEWGFAPSNLINLAIYLSINIKS